MVKVLPRPGSLSTVMSPPIIRQSRRLSASPSPVPPYLRVVGRVGLGELLEEPRQLLGVMPMPGVAHR